MFKVAFLSMASSAKQSKMDYFATLREDALLIHIFSYLSAKDLLRISGICRRFYAVGSNKILWLNLSQHQRWPLNALPTTQETEFSKNQPEKAAVMRQMRVDYNLRHSQSFADNKIVVEHRGFVGWEMGGKSLILYNGSESEDQNEIHHILAFSLKNGQPICRLVELGDYTREAQLANDDKLLLSISHDEMLKVWDVQTDKCLYTIAAESNFDTDLQCLTSDGKIGAYGLADGKLLIWDMESGKQLSKLDAHSSAVCCVKLNKTHIVTADKDGNVKIWDRQNNFECTNTLATASRIACLTLLSTKLIIGAGMNQVWVYEIASGEKLQIDEVPNSYFLSVYKNQLVCGYEGILKVWDLDSGKLIKALNVGEECCMMKCVLQNGLAAFIGDDTGCTVKLVDINTAGGDVVRSLEFEDPVLAVDDIRTTTTSLVVKLESCEGNKSEVFNFGSKMPLDA